MFLEIVKSEGLSHLSYMIGDKGSAAVIDPRRDVESYLDFARQHEARITHIFETHRNEDYVSGGRELAARTGAAIFHGRAAGEGYWHGVGQGDEFTFGSMRLMVLETPGHTFDSISLALYDTDWSDDDPAAIFTGDALFIGDVGRTDFFPDRKAEVANLLYDSLHGRLLPLGDHVLLYPAHGAGSVCGSGMAKREFSSIGYERRNNKILSLPRQEFVDHKMHERHDMPPYFKQMEKRNQEGPPVLGCLPEPPALGVDDFQELIDRGAQLVDIRHMEGYSAASVPGSIALPLDMLGGFAGYFLQYDKPILLIADNAWQVSQAVPLLVRMDYVDIAGYLAGGVAAWNKAARKFQRVPLVDVEYVRGRLESNDPEHILLDVRKPEEYKSQHLPGSQHIYLGDLPGRLNEVPRDKTITTFCGSGQRAMLAASILKRAGFESVQDHAGSMSAAKSTGLDLQQVQ